MKYIVDVPDEVPVSDELVPFDMCRPSWYLEAYEKGKADAEDEVWEFVRIITDMTEKQRIECFGGATCDLDEYWTYQDAKTKYDAWKKKKEQVRVGDEVEYECDGRVRFVVLEIVGRKAYGFKYPCDYADVGEYCDIDRLTKTGRHFPEVAELLKKMRDTE